MNRDIASWFADYAALVAQQFGDRLHATATINEPWCVAFLSHFLGIHAPGYRDIRAAARAMHHVLFAHGTAIDALRAEGAKNLGIVHQPRKSPSPPPTARGRRRRAHRRWHLQPLVPRWRLQGPIPRRRRQACSSRYLPDDFEDDMDVVSRPLDWARHQLLLALAATAPAPTASPPSRSGPLEKNDLGWEIYPKGLTDLLVRVSRDYTKVPLYVTENGMSENNDERRVNYYDDAPQGGARRPESRAPMSAATSPGRCSTTTNGPRATPRASASCTSTTRPSSAPPKAATAPSRACCTTRGSFLALAGPCPLPCEARGGAANWSSGDAEGAHPARHGGRMPPAPACTARRERGAPPCCCIRYSAGCAARQRRCFFAVTEHLLAQEHG